MHTAALATMVTTVLAVKPTTFSLVIIGSLTVNRNCRLCGGIDRRCYSLRK
jgi:hypothetical protein